MSAATLHTNHGAIELELFDDDAPKTVENFRKLAGDGFYDGIVFHRVIPNFVVQGGDPLTREHGLNHPAVGSGGPGWKIKCETQGNPHRHEEGSLSMAHAGKDTGGSQFFIVLSEQATTHLNGVHTVFGKVTEGIEVVRQLQKGDRMDRVTVADA